MNSGKIFFGDVKEYRGWYFVEYSPPSEGCRFANLSLTILGDEIDKAKIGQAMETELLAWFSRYPVSIMVFAFDAAGNVIHFKPIKESDSLMGFLKGGETAVRSEWRLLENKELLDNALNRDYLKSIYSDIPFRTNRDIERECKNYNRKVRAIKVLVIFVTIVIPLAVIILPEISRPIAVIVLVYGILKIIGRILKRTGVIKTSVAQITREKEELEMRHHHHHCKKDPQAFLRLKSENFEREERERISKEAAAIKPTP